MINLFISEAFAENVANATEVASQGNFSPASFVPLILIFVIFYFLIIRPQTKKIKEHEQMVNNLKIGNKVITSGGIVGVVRGIDSKNNQLEIEIAENVTINVVKSFVTEVEKPRESTNDHKTTSKKSKK